MKYLILLIIIFGNVKAQDYEWSYDYSKNIGRIDDISSFNDNEIVLLDSRLGFLGSGDGGVNWSHMLIYSNYQHNSLNIVNPFYMFVVSHNKANDKGALFMSGSKGFQWIKANHEFDSPLIDVEFFDDKYGIVLNNLDSIYVTENRGQSFEFLYKFNNRINEIKFINDLLWAFGDEGALYNSSDNGVSWNKIETNTNEKINDVFMSHSKIYLAGSNGFFAERNISAGSWYIENLGEIDLYAIDFYNDSLGIVVGGNTETGIGFITTDMGDTWEKQNVPECIYYDAYFKNPDKIITCGLHYESENVNYGLIAYADKVTSVFEYKNSTMSVNPNPASDYIEISFSNKGLQPFENRGEIEIYDVLGECVLKSNSVASQTTHRVVSTTGRIDISHLPRGIYFVKFGGNVKKFIKN